MAQSGVDVPVGGGESPVTAPATTPVPGEPQVAEPQVATPLASPMPAGPVLTAVRAFDNVDTTLAESVAKMQALLHQSSPDAVEASKATWFGPSAHPSTKPEDEYDEDQKELEAKEAAAKKAQDDLAEAKQKIEAKKERARRDAATAASSVGLPPGMALPRVRTPDPEENKALFDTLQQLMSQVHALSKVLG